MKLDDCTKMVGFSDRSHGLIAASDIVMLCSEKEGIPRSIMEAMALRKPVVATNVLGTEELVIDGQTGFLLPRGDIDGLVDKIKLLAEDVNLRARMGSRGRERICGHFNDVKIAGFLREFCLRVAPTCTT